ncbi:MAG: hypothetical protein KDC73_01325 [Ignavibacteriae bacterium]|nr:hypothetical protein [Ignavibacteriota bacterium]MCB9243162.1 hypothetical protein [Ignavibacteriales bacterium]
MKKLITCLVFCCAFVAGCDESTTDVIITEQLVAEYPGDSVSTTGSGAATKTSTISSSSLDFTNADSMRIKITYWGSTNNTSTNAINIGYIFSTSPDSNVYVYSIPSSIVTTAETTLDVTIGSPKVNKSFIYNLVYLNTDGFGGYLKFKDLKIYRK